MPRSLFQTRTLLILVTAVAAFYRFYHIDRLPPGFQFDQAYYVFDVLRLLQGQYSIFFAAPGGTEPLYIYLATVGTAIFGITPLGLKLTTAVIGTVTVPCIFGLARTMFRSNLVGVLAGLLAAVSVWHIFFSRYGERVVLLVLLAVFALWFFWRALEHGRRRDFIYTGVFVGLGLCTYPAARVWPVALILIALYFAWEQRPRARIYLAGLALVLGVAIILFLPLAFYFFAHPDQFISHSADVSVFVPHNAVQENVAAALAGNGLRLLEMFFVKGDGGMIRNVPGRPVFDPATALLFLAGVATLCMALLGRRGDRDRRRAVFLSAWILVSLGVSLFTDDAPNFVRTLPAMPAVVMVAAWGGGQVWERLQLTALRNAAAPAFAVILIAGSWSSFHDYFVSFSNDPGLYYTFNADKEEVSAWINQNARTSHVFLAPVWYQVSTISLLTRNSPLKSFESRDTIVLPSRASGEDALFVFPYDQEKKAQTMQSRLGNLGTIENLIGSNGQRLLLYYRVPANLLPDPRTPLETLAQGGAFVHPHNTETAIWSNQIKLLGSSVDPAGPGGRNLTVTLFLQQLAPMGDYTFSIKVWDGKNRVWGQEDKWPGDNSYATSQWEPGDVIVERFYPGLDPCAPEGDYRVTVEAYNPRTMQVLPLSDRAGTLVQLGSFHAGPSDGNRVDDLAPEKQVNLTVAPQWQLMGLTAPTEGRPGTDFSLSLYWRGTGKGTVPTATQVSLRDAGQREFTLGQQVISLPDGARGLCTLFDLTVPPDAAVGPGSLWVDGTKITTLNVVR